MSIFELSGILKEHPIKPAGRATAPKHSNPKDEPSPQDMEKMAQAALDDLAAKFPAWASGDVQKMKQAIGEASGVFGEKRAHIIRNNIYPKAHDLKGQGSTFGYPLITDIGTHLCRLITSKTNYEADDFSAIRSDILMMETVLWKKLKGDGGSKGAEILRKLNT